MAFTGYLKLPDIPGESVKADHTDEIDIFGADFSVMQESSATATTGLVAGTAHASSFNFQKFYDASSVYLMQASLTGAHLADAVFAVRKDSGDAHLDYLTVTLTNVVVSNYSLSGGGDQNIVESISLSAEEIKFTYVQQGADGAASNEHEFAYNLVEGAAV